MFRRISLLNKRGFFPKKENFKRGFLFSPLLIIPLFLVIISGLLIKSIQGDFLVSNYLSHIFTGFLGYFLAFFISYIPVERIRKYLVPFYLCTLISLSLIYFFGISVSGAIVVTTPQQVSLQDARRGLAMFKQLGVPLLGIVENMSVFIPPDMPNKKYEIFGKGGGQILAKENDLPLLAQIPIEIPLVDDSNKGVPISISQPNKDSSIAFSNLAQLIKDQFVMR